MTPISRQGENAIHGHATPEAARPGFRREPVEIGVEAICNKGCQAVRDDLAALERGETPPELNKLTTRQREEVCRQLRSIMAVYGDMCRID